MHADIQLCQQLFGLGVDHEGKARVDYRDLSPRIKVSGRAYISPPPPRRYMTEIKTLSNQSYFPG